MTQRPMSLDVMLETLNVPVVFIGRCRSCGKVGYQHRDDGNDKRECGLDPKGGFCYGSFQGLEDISQDALLAAYRLGGEEAVEELLVGAGYFVKKARC